MKIFKSLQISVDFSTRFLIILLDSGGPALNPHTNPYFQNVLNFSQRFSENFDVILKDFQKSQSFL